MSGTRLFSFFKPALLLLVFLFKMIPTSILDIFWSLLIPFEGKISCAIRYALIKCQAHKCGDNVFIGRNVTLKNIHKLSVGSNTSIHANCYVDAAGEIIIGSNVSIAHNSSLISFEHTWSDLNKPIKYNKTVLNKVYISNDVWLGCGVRVLSGTTIEPRVVVAAGSVVKGTLRNNSIYAGIPCKKVKDLK